MNVIIGNMKQKERTLGRRTAMIVEDMGAAIVTGAYKPDELLPIEAELGEKHHASRSVLREAVKVLNAKGLLTARPRKGTSVTHPSDWNLFDPDVLRWTLRGSFSLPLLIEFTQVRLAIEPMAAALAARQGSDQALLAIQAAYEQMAACMRQKEDDLVADINFHLAILDASGNQFFSRLKPLVDAALRFSIQYTDDIARDEGSKLRAHEELMEAIVERNPVQASQNAYKLLNDVLAFMNAPTPAT